MSAIDEVDFGPEMKQARANGQTMDVDAYCQICKSVICVMARNVIGHETCLHHEYGFASMKCNKCGKKKGVTVRCYIPNAHDPYEGLRR